MYKIIGHSFIYLCVGIKIVYEYTTSTLWITPNLDSAYRIEIRMSQSLTCPNEEILNMFELFLKYWVSSSILQMYKQMEEAREKRERENKIQTSKLLLEKYSARFVPRIGMVWSEGTLTFARNERKWKETRASGFFFHYLFIFFRNHNFFFLFWCWCWFYLFI